MRTRRLKVPADFAAGYYHCVSRVVDRQRVFGAREKEQFVRYMRLYEGFCQLRILAYCVMSNHFHILLEVPQRPAAADLPDDAALVEHVRVTLGEKQAAALAWQLNLLRERGADQEAEAVRASWFARMWDLSAFMKVLKQRFSQWFNRTCTQRRCGTLWEDRFRSVLVQGQCHALQAMAAYIELNPLRAGMHKDPKDYRWCSYAEAVAGGGLASRAVQWLMTLPAPGGARAAEPELSLQASLARYRRVLFGVEGGRQRDLTAAQISAVLKSGGKLPLHEYLRCRVRYFSDGVVLGSAEFVDEVFRRMRERFSSKRESGARAMQGLATAEQAKLCTCRELKARLFG